jgi:hypothetical protein
MPTIPTRFTRRGLLGLGLAALPAGHALAQDLLKDALGVLNSLGTGGGAGGLTNGEVTEGLLEALRVGTERVVATVGALDGYNLDPEIHIPLPESLQKVQSALQLVGMSGLADDVELKINRAAETAAPLAKDVFWDAINQMTLDDAMAIYNGPQDAATRYFERTMTPSLVDKMRPIVDSSLAEVGAVQAYNAMMEPYKAMPLMPDIQANLTDYALEGALGGLFHKLAAEEAAIRSNPAKQTTEILRKVFG